MLNSSLIQDKILSPNHSGKRTEKICKIAIHHAAGVINGRNLASLFVSKTRKASANYCLGSDGVIILGVDEQNRAWTTSSSWCDNRAVTIEVGNSTCAPQWLVSNYVLKRLIDLVTDICRRNEIYPCTYTGGKDGVLQMHKWYAKTSCPGPYLSNKLAFIADEVNKRLRAENNKPNETSTIYRVRKTWKDTKSQIGAFKYLELAKRCVNKNPQYKVFDDKGAIVYEIKNDSKTDKIAREVIRGLWGTGSERKRRLLEAGYDYYEIQKKVNEIIK